MKRDERMRLVVPLTVALIVAGDPAEAQPADSGITTYRAVYDVEYKGKMLGTAEFSVTYDEHREVYRFESRAQAKGFLKIVTPNPVIQRSEFRVDGGSIQPLEFWYEDGKRKGEDNAHVVFDWDRRVAVSETEGARHELALTPGVLDSGSMQVALMRDLARTGRPGTYLLADGDSVKTYEYCIVIHRRRLLLGSAQADDPRAFVRAHKSAERANARAIPHHLRRSRRNPCADVDALRATRWGNRRCVRARATRQAPAPNRAPPPPEGGRPRRPNPPSQQRRRP